MKTPRHHIAVQPARDGDLLVCLSGEFDMSCGTALTDVFEAASREPGVGRVTVDLERVTFFDSHGLAGLVMGYEAARAAGRRFVVIRAQGMLKEVLRVTGLAEVLGGQESPATG